MHNYLILHDHVWYGRVREIFAWSISCTSTMTTSLIKSIGSVLNQESLNPPPVKVDENEMDKPSREQLISSLNVSTLY